MSKNQKQTQKQECNNNAPTNSPRNTKGGNNRNSNRGKQGRKDSRSDRVNFDNERESKFIKQYEKRGMRQKTSDGANDISWYSRNPELLKSAASFPFTSVVGQTLRLGRRQYVPGVMVLPFSFAVGGLADDMYSDGTNTAVNSYPISLNQSGKSIYSFLVHANSRNYTYEYQDLTMVIMAGVQVFAALAHVIRAYAVAKHYSERSIYKPEAYLVAMGFRPDDVRDNLSQMWFDINQLIAQTTQIWIPSEQPFLKRWIWMCSNIYTDADSALGQNYLFVPTRFWQFSETGDSSGTSLEPATYWTGDKYAEFAPGKDKTYLWSEWFNAIQHMIDRLVNSEDRGIMFGDILNAYGADRIFAMPSIPADIQLEPVYSPEVLTQIENLTITSAECLGLRQTTQGIYPLFKGASINTVGQPNRASQCIAPQTPVLNFHQQASPTPEQIMIATRLTAAGSIISNNTYNFNSPGTSDTTATVASDPIDAYVVPLVCGTEMINSMYFITKDQSIATSWAMTEYPWDTNYATTSLSMFNLTCPVPGDYMAFDWAPFIYYLSQPADLTEGEAGLVVAAYGDYDNYTVLNVEMLRKIHQVALMSEFGLPIM